MIAPGRIIKVAKENLEKVVAGALLCVLIFLGIHLAGRAGGEADAETGAVGLGVAQVEDDRAERLRGMQAAKVLHMGFLLGVPENHYRPLVERNPFVRVPPYEIGKLEKARRRLREAFMDLGFEPEINEKYDCVLLKIYGKPLAKLEMDEIAKELQRIFLGRPALLPLMKLKDELESCGRVEPRTPKEPECVLGLALVGTVRNPGGDIAAWIEDRSGVGSSETYILAVGEMVPGCDYRVKKIEMDESVVLEKDGCERDVSLFLGAGTVDPAVTGCLEVD